MFFDQIAFIIVLSKIAEKGSEFDSLVTICDKFSQDVLRVFLEEPLDVEDCVVSNDFGIE
jgi:hypothetical protein